MAGNLSQMETIPSDTGGNVEGTLCDESYSGAEARPRGRAVPFLVR